MSFHLEYKHIDNGFIYKLSTNMITMLSSLSKVNLICNGRVSERQIYKKTAWMVTKASVTNEMAAKVLQVRLRMDKTLNVNKY